MKKRYAVVATIAALAIPVAVVEGFPSESQETCPEGQELVGFNAENFEATQKPPPLGAHFEDRFGKATVRSDGDSASGNVPLTIECR